MQSNPTLADLEPGERAIVREVSKQLPALERRRLIELGFYPGTPVLVALESPLGDPVAYQVRQMTVALRREQARMIEVDRHA